MDRELLREIGIVILVVLVLFSAAVVLFFAEGGEVYGVNHDPTNPVISLEHPEFVIEVIDEEIVPIYDGTEIKTVELWELPPKEIIRQLIISPMAYIPPITSHLITLFVSSLGLAFLVLYRRKDKQLENERPEQILAYLSKNPGHSLQQITDALAINRSTARHYLRSMEKSKTLSAAGYRGHTHYFAGGSGISETERLMYIILSQEKARQVIRIIREHPGITKQELAGKLRISPSSCNWYLRRFRDDGVIMIIFDGVHNHYRLTSEAEAAYKTILTDQAETEDPDITVS
ncbi:MAG TPA: winged helix-turn-helix transcriptional regulator [Methanocorpusculum sp.]|nr:winged helix-turn-helix transcriptional regulator [Methanocorpusculum sp.]